MNKKQRHSVIAVLLTMFVMGVLPPIYYAYNSSFAEYDFIFNVTSEGRLAIGFLHLLAQWITVAFAGAALYLFFDDKKR